MSFNSRPSVALSCPSTQDQPSRYDVLPPIRELCLSQFFGTFFGSPSWVSERRNILIREPITSPTGVKYEWNDEKKDYFNEKDEILPEEGFHHEGVCYNYNIETNSWMADGKPLQSSQSQTYKDENGTTYFWNEVKKLWVTGKFFGSTVLVEKNTDQIALIYTMSVRLTMI